MGLEGKGYNCELEFIFLCLEMNRGRYIRAIGENLKTRPAAWLMTFLARARRRHVAFVGTTTATFIFVIFL